MKQATFTEVRNHAKRYFDLVEAGESVRVLRNGIPIADIVPVTADLPSWKRRSVQPLVLDGVAVSRLILEERVAWAEPREARGGWACAITPEG